MNLNRTQNVHTYPSALTCMNSLLLLSEKEVKKIIKTYISDNHFTLLHLIRQIQCPLTFGLTGVAVALLMLVLWPLIMPWNGSLFFLWDAEDTPPLPAVADAMTPLPPFELVPCV